MASQTVPMKKFFTEQLWTSNQVLIAILGICSALGITIKMSTAITMMIAVTFVTGGSSFLVSLIRKHTPDTVRMITQLAVISLFTIIVAELLKAYLFDTAKTLSVYVGLIITNCIVMGRAEGMAKSVPPLPALLDGLGAGAGYGAVLCIVAAVREVLGSGAFFGYKVIPASWYASATNPDGYQNFGIMLLAPAAFFLIGILIFAANTIQNKNKH